MGKDLGCRRLWGEASGSFGHQAAALGQSSSLFPGLGFPLSNKGPCPLVVTQPQEGEGGDSVARRGSLQITRLSLTQYLGDRGLLARAPAQQSPLPTPTAENPRDSLQEDYGLIPCRLHPRRRNRVPGQGSREGALGASPPLTPPQPCGSARGPSGNRVAA